MTISFKVTWKIEYYEADASYTTEEVFESESLNNLIQELDKGLEKGHHTPELKVPFHEGDFNIGYVSINTLDGKEVYRDES